jgi:pimeloyl-ACP methyl ester carboxylesterase
MLEIIDKGRTTASHPVPLLFVHGAYHAAWCWNENFLDFFAASGFRAVALSLRGHGASTVSKHLNACSLADYVADVSAVVDKLGSVPVLIGHSMGCFVIQRYLETRDAPGAILMAPATPQGLRRSVLHMFRNHPWIFLRSMTFGDPVELVNSPALAREFMFCAHTPESIVESCARRMEPESARIGKDTMFGAFNADKVTTPLLVLGAEDDGSRVDGDVAAVAHTYGTTAELFPTMGHNMMLEPGWPKVADTICEWLATKNL